MPLHLEEFQRDQLQGYVENVPPNRDYALAGLFPDEDVYDIEFAYNVISGSYSQMASITAYDAGAPLRDKDVLARITGEIGKVQHGYRLTEKELLMFNRPRMDSERKKVVDAVYDNTDKLVFGVMDREEWLRAQAVYKGELTYAENDVKATIDFQIPAENKLTVTTAWATDASSALEDLQTALTQFEDANNGESPLEMHMSRAVESLLLKSPSIKAQVFGTTNDSRIVTGDQLNNLLTSLGLPPYRVVSQKVKGEGNAESLIPSDRVVFVGSDLGNTLKGPTVENNYQPGIYVIPQITETNPPSQEVYVGETVFPALKRPSAVVHLVIE